MFSWSLKFVRFNYLVVYCLFHSLFLIIEGTIEVVLLFHNKQICLISFAQPLLPARLVGNHNTENSAAKSRKMEPKYQTWLMRELAIARYCMAARLRVGWIMIWPVLCSVSLTPSKYFFSCGKIGLRFPFACCFYSVTNLLFASRKLCAHLEHGILTCKLYWIKGSLQGFVCFSFFFFIFFLAIYIC